PALPIYHSPQLIRSSCCGQLQSRRRARVYPKIFIPTQGFIEACRSPPGGDRSPQAIHSNRGSWFDLDVAPRCAPTGFLQFQRLTEAFWRDRSPQVTVQTVAATSSLDVAPGCTPKFSFPPSGLSKHVGAHPGATDRRRRSTHTLAICLTRRVGIAAGIGPPIDFQAAGRDHGLGPGLHAELAQDGGDM